MMHQGSPTSVWLHSKDQSSEASQTFSNRRISARSSSVQSMPGRGGMAMSGELSLCSRPLALWMVNRPDLSAHVNPVEDHLPSPTQISDQPVDVVNLFDFG